MTTLLVAVAVLGACSGGEANNDDNDDDPTTTTSLPIPAECDGVDLPRSEDGTAVAVVQESVPEACRHAIFNQAIDGVGSNELKEIDPDQRLGLALGLCAYSRTLAEPTENVPSYSGFVRSTAESWGTPESVVDEVVGFTATVCPTQLEPLLGLRAEKTANVVEVSAAGIGRLTVTYTGPTGEEMSAEGNSPWEHEIRLPEGTDFRVHVVADEGKAQCTVRGANRTELTADKPEDAKEATCEVSADKIRAAAW